MRPEDALDFADRLAHPISSGLPTGKAWWPQSLAHGVPGIALLHIELAAAGQRPWQRVHDWLTVATASPVARGASTALFYGAPAVATALAAAASVRPGAYRGALAALDARITADAHRRVDTANSRIHEGALPVMAEFDTIRGLAGIGAYLLSRTPDMDDALRAVLGYLVRMTTPLGGGGTALPGWWTGTGPTGHPETEFAGGHGNFGLAHGIGGPLALLSLAALRGITVPGQPDAITRICTWLDSWRIDTPAGVRWPYMITREELDTKPAHPHHSGARRRPSWCYGTVGLARAQQLAALATGDSDRRLMAEESLLSALTDPAQRAATTDGSLCHGYAGLAHIAALAAADSGEPTAARLRGLAPELLAAAQPTTTDATGSGLLEGAAGIALAALAPTAGHVPATGWDTCLLIA
ncbi:lanthionine synthetase C family protein [Streptomyces sp. NPDC004838]